MIKYEIDPLDKQKIHGQAGKIGNVMTFVSFARFAPSPGRSWKLVGSRIARGLTRSVPKSKKHTCQRYGLRWQHPPLRRGGGSFWKKLWLRILRRRPNHGSSELAQQQELVAGGF